MTAHPTPSAFEARTNATYEALMWALARPGLSRTLPEAGQAGILEALIDRECAVHCTRPEMAAQAARTGAALVSPDAADHVFCDALADTDLLARLRMGSDLYPEEGATLVVNARIGSGARLRLSGPGCDGLVPLQLGGLPDGFWAERARVMRYPMGFELFVLDGAEVMGIPRSTEVEVL